MLYDALNTPKRIHVAELALISDPAGPGAGFNAVVTGDEISISRDDADFTWEKTDKADALKAAL